MLKINLRRPIIITATRFDKSPYEIKAQAVEGRVVNDDEGTTYKLEVIRAFTHENGGRVSEHQIGTWIKSYDEITYGDKTMDPVYRADHREDFRNQYLAPENWVGKLISISEGNIDSIEEEEE